MASGRRRFITTGMGGALALGSSGSLLAGSSEPIASTLPFFEVLRRRRTVRRYKSAAVPDAHLNAILEAGRLAPDSANQQPWRFLVLKDRAKVEQIREAALASPHAEMGRDPKAYLDGLLAAPVFVLVFIDKQAAHPQYRIQDGTLAAGQMMLAARALGYGTVFLTTGIPEDATRKVLGTPDRYLRICMMPIGIPDAAGPDGWPASPPKKHLDEIVVADVLK